MDENFERRIIAEWKRRSAKLPVVKSKAEMLRNRELQKEANAAFRHFELLVNELEAFYTQYREVLVKYGIVPKEPLKIMLTEKELDIANHWQQEHHKKFGISTK